MADPDGEALHLGLRLPPSAGSGESRQQPPAALLLGTRSPTALVLPAYCGATAGQLQHSVGHKVDACETGKQAWGVGRQVRQALQAGAAKIHPHRLVLSPGWWLNL